MSATLTVRRDAVGIELRRGTFDIELDGNRAATIDWHQTVELTLEPGHHTIQITAGRYSSRPGAVDIADGVAVTLRCHGAMVWPRYVASIIAPNLAISVRREHG